MRSEEAVCRAIDQYATTVQRICFIHLKNEADTDDIFQTVFLKYAMSTVTFENDAHEKAWLIRVTINACKDLLKNFFRKHTVPLDDYIDQLHVTTSIDDELFEAMLALPEKYRRVVYLHFYEGYTAPEMSKILGVKVNTIYTQLTRAKELLRTSIGGDV